MRITFYGAAREVTGSCFLVEAGGKKFLVDCGLFQGARLADARNHEPFPFSPAAIDAVLLTHVHADHSGKIPKLVHEGFTGRVFATGPTAELAVLLWKDNFDIMAYDHSKTGHPPLFDLDDVARAAGQLTKLNYRERLEVAPGVFATWFDAGHVLGSSFILLEADGRRVVFSGDLGNHGAQILYPTESLPTADLLLVEATYGGREHEDPRTRSEKLLRALKETISGGGVLMIPSFAIERTQELLFDLNEIVEKHKIPRVPIFLDSPLAIDALDVYRKYQSWLKMDAVCIVRCGDDFFKFPGLTLTRSREESRKINEAPAPKVIIAGAGMMNGGRIVHHLIRYLPDSRSEVLVIGYQAAGTLGREVLDGNRQVRIFNETVPVRARVRAIGAYSAHADREKLLSWLAAGKPKRVAVIHSDAPVADAFAQAIESQLGIKTHLPVLGESIEVGGIRKQILQGTRSF
ncbi:MBL fold metallo-hydrolase [Patescibacteria group bacterium]|nr:MAG: MBL fold metallo-hydrolase [Patescibacteria group bacterium]